MSQTVWSVLCHLAAYNGEDTKVINFYFSLYSINFLKIKYLILILTLDWKLTQNVKARLERAERTVSGNVPVEH